MFLSWSALPALLGTLFVLTVTLAPLTITTGYSFTIDSLTRLNSNDTYLGTYYFWWTNLTYLPSFFFVLLAIATTLFLKTYFVRSIIIGSVLIALHSIELNDYLALNALELVTPYGSFGSNFLLTNTLNRYHPLVFYTSTVLLISLLFPIIVFSLHARPFQFNQRWWWTDRLAPFATLINLLALWMGSWWALQEGTWGGWWNWDSSETFGLLVALTTLAFYHFRRELKSQPIITIRLGILTASFFLSYFFIQLNFDLVSHNFGSKFFFFFNNNLFFLQSIGVLLLLVLALTTYFSKNTLQLSVLAHKYYTIHPFSILRLTPVLVILVWVLASYRPLLNYFFWNFFDVNIFNSEISLQLVHVPIWITLAIWLSRVNQRFTILISTLVLLSVNWVSALALLIIPCGLSSFLHTTLILIAITNHLIYDLTFLTWVTETTTQFEFAPASISFSTDELFTIDSFVIESTQIWSTASFMYGSSWNIYALSNTPAINFFSLNSTHDVFQNYYSLGISYQVPCVYLELLLLPTLNLFFFIGCLPLILTMVSKSIKIEW